MVGFASMTLVPATVSAATQTYNTSCTLEHPATNFLSFPTWYQYIKNGKTNIYTYTDPKTSLEVTTTKCNIPDIGLSNGGFSGTGILLVLLAIIDILLRLSGLVALGFIVYGGIRFVTSQGSSDGTKQARETVLNGIIGMVIATIAIAVVTFLGDKLG